LREIEGLAILSDADHDLGVAKGSAPSAKRRNVKVKHREEGRSRADRDVNLDAGHESHPDEL
jgi:hypothetical protein